MNESMNTFNTKSENRANVGDYVLARKVFRKFEALNLSYIRDEIDGLLAYLDELFGEENMNCLLYTSRCV